MSSSKPPFSSTTASLLLDALRGIAALLVLLEHWRNLFFVDFRQVQHHRAVLGGLYILCGAGHQAVVIFFVLSGYLISGTVLRSIRRRQWSWPQYLTHRLVRLWLVLLPALLLGAAWDFAGLHLHQAPQLYSGAGENHMTPDVAASLTPSVVVGNASFFQTILVPTLGSNGALWSLANEWWYYILFPLAACALSRVYSQPILTATCVVLFCAVSFFIGKTILLLFPVWLLGALLFVVRPPRNRFNSQAMLSAAFLYAVAFFGFVVLDHNGGKLVLLIMPGNQGVIADTGLALVTFAFLWILLSAYDKAHDNLFVRVLRGAARFSYTLYVTHLPILFFFAALLVHDTRWTVAPRHVLVACLVLGITVGYAWLVASFTEFRTDSVRRLVENHIIGRAVTIR